MDCSTHKISVVIPIYNVETTLIRCIESVHNQAYRNIEIILVDDGSQDSSALLCDLFVSDDSRVTVIHKNNAGLSVARNIGISMSIGEFIFFLDSDDWLEINSFQEWMTLADASELFDLMILSAQKVEASDGKSSRIGVAYRSEEWREISGVDALRVLLRDNPKYEWYAWKYLYRSNFLKKNGFTFLPGRYYEDVEWTPKIFYAAQRVIYSDYIAINYWFHNPSSILNTPSIKKTIDKIEIAGFSCELASALDDDLQHDICATFAKLYISGFGDYLQGTTAVYSLLKKNSEILIYSHDRLGRVLNIMRTIFGFRVACQIIKGYYRIKNIKKFGRRISS